MKQYKQLTSELRYQIYGLKQAGLNQTEIAQKMGVDKGTIVLAKLVVNLCRGCRGSWFKICIVTLRPAIFLKIVRLSGLLNQIKHRYLL